MNLGPIAYVQQIIVKAMVHPYKKDEMIKTDAFRGPLASAFKLHLQDLALFRDLSTNQDMDHLCLRTDGLSDKYRHNNIIAKMLPDYGCLMLSPANLWERDLRSFQMDANVISTVFNFQGKVMFFLVTAMPNQNENAKTTAPSNFDAEAFGDMFSTLYNRI